MKIHHYLLLTDPQAVADQLPYKLRLLFKKGMRTKGKVIVCAIVPKPHSQQTVMIRYEVEECNITYVSTMVMYVRERSVQIYSVLPLAGHKPKHISFDHYAFNCSFGDTTIQCKYKYRAYKDLDQ